MLLLRLDGVLLLRFERKNLFRSSSSSSDGLRDRVNILTCIRLILLPSLIWGQRRCGLRTPRISDPIQEKVLVNIFPDEEKLKTQAEAVVAEGIRRSEAATIRHSAAPGKVAPTTTAKDTVRA